MTLKVGDELFMLDRWPRKGDPRWTPFLITGETKLSWLVGEGWEQQKVNKKTMMTKADWRGQHDRFYTRQGRDDYDLCDRLRRPLMTAVEQCDDPEKMKKIAEIIGMELK